jgi:hypothetical protein
MEARKGALRHPWLLATLVSGCGWAADRSMHVHRPLAAKRSSRRQQRWSTLSADQKGLDYDRQ